MTELYNQNDKNQLQKEMLQPCPPTALDGGGMVAGGPPCLFSNNSTESVKTSHSGQVKSETVRLSSYHKKQAETLSSNVRRLVEIESLSINHVAFLTLTFQENITDHKEAYRRFRSFNSHFLVPHLIYGQWVSVKEHQARGAWHFHMIIQLTEDIRTGFDFDLFDEWLDGPRLKGTFPTGNDVLRSLWVELGQVLPEYRFGKIFTLEPIRSNAEAVSRYVGKYVSKQIGQRSDSDKGVRLINYSKGWLKNSVQLAWFNDNSTLWREKVSIFARLNGCQEMYQLSEKLGPDWAYRYTQEIVDIEPVPKRFIEEVYGSEKVYVNKMIPEMEEKADIRHRAFWNKAAIENFEFEDSKRKAALKQKVAQRSADLARNKKNQKSRVKVQALVNTGCKSWFDPRMIEYFKKESQEDIREMDLKIAKHQYDKLQRMIQGGWEYKVSGKIPF